MKPTLHDISLAVIVFVVGAAMQLTAGGMSINHAAVVAAISAGLSAVLHKFYPKDDK